MFTGVIQTRAKIVSIEDRTDLRRLLIDFAPADVRHGDSIAVNGCCLTVAHQTPTWLSFDCIAETLSKTNLGTLAVGDEVNIERALRLGDRLDGHFVQGHVDGTGTLLNTKIKGDDWRLTIEAPDALRDYLIPKGSITLDGVSLTLADVRDHEFDVALIPTTLQITTLGTRPAGWRFNLEADQFSKTIIATLRRIGVARAD